MTGAQATAAAPDPFAHEILALDQGWDELVRQMQHLYQGYLAQVLVALPDYLITQVRSLCTGPTYAGVFLELEPEQKTKLLRDLHQVIHDCCTAFRESDPTILEPDQLDEQIDNLLSQAEQQLQQRLLPLLGENVEATPPRLALRQLDLELNDPILRQLRAEMRVLSGRGGYLQREIERIQSKQRQWQAEQCWDALFEHIAL
ncbi:MAG: hypothetical protein HC921_03035 [Synechococcaceae cyanobacterium SM2_3_1]|nr:hypothetical protein [Synechococcaceae cyanobacterium SM2_3_1]